MSITYDSALEQITQSVFSTMPGLELFRIDAAAPTDGEMLLVAVHIAGAWTGSVVLGLPNDVIRAAAAGMLQVSSDEVRDEDSRDVAAELVNMIGGNLKSLLPGPSFLSLPTIVQGRDCGLDVHDGRLVEDLAMQSEFGSLVVRLYERIAPDRHTSVGSA
jgi:chemotaxis protein CheX